MPAPIERGENMTERAESLAQKILRKKGVAVPPAAPPPVDDVAPAPEKPKKEAADVIVYACGHRIGRRHIEGQNCVGCNVKARQENRKRREEKRASEVPIARDSGRLPDGATFHVVYDATAEKWTGRLSVPEAGTFDSSAGGVFKLLQKLDGQFRGAIRNEVDDGTASG